MVELAIRTTYNRLESENELLLNPTEVAYTTK